MSEAKPSTFLIKSTQNKSFGTGFCVHKDEKGSFLLTCAHVVNACGEESLEVNDCPTTVVANSNDAQTVDIAVVYVEGLTDATTLKLSDAIFNENDPFKVNGFRPHKNGEYREEPLDGVIKKISNIFFTLANESISTYQLSIENEDSIEKGYSGSAVIDVETGFVIAIATDRNSNGQEAFASPAKYLKEIWQEMPNNLFVSNEMTNPYKGLHSFAYEDRHNYYGREKESKAIAGQLPKTKLFTLLGASGSGKSSLIFAGVMPEIESDEVQILSLRPQSHPFKSLATVFIPTLYPDKLDQIEQSDKLTAKLASHDIKLNNLAQTFLQESKAKYLYLIVDQFEELFTLTKEQKERNLFLDQLLTLINSELNVTILLSMRADFLSHLSYYEPFNQAYNEHPNTILSLLSKEKLEKVIEQPALAQGVKFQDGLVDRIIDEIETEAGQLPLLEFALDQLWTNKKGRVISHEVLDEMKSISHSISHYADKIYDETEDKESIKKVLIKLVNPGAGTEDTRRIASLDEFSELDRKTIVKLANERLIVTQDQNIDIVHEALIREWGQLQEWIEEYREFLEWEKRLRDDRKVYEENGSKKEDLLKDSRLLKAEEFLGSHGEYIFLKGKKFIKESIKKETRKKRNHKILLALIFISLLGIIGVIFNLKQEATNKTNAITIFTSKIISTLMKTEDKVLEQYLDEVFNSGEREIFIEILKPLISEASSLDLNEKEYWYDTLPSMNNKQVLRLVKILMKESKEIYISKSSFDILRECAIYENDINETYCLFLFDKNGLPYSNFYSDAGMYYFVHKEYDKSEGSFEKSIELNPNNEEAYLGIIKLYEELKQYGKAIKTIKIHSIKFDKISSLDGDAYKYLKKGLFNEALEIGHFAIQSNLKNYLIYKIMGASYLNLKEYDKSIKYFNLALEKKQSDAGSYNGLADAYSHKHQYDKAIKAYIQTIKINPKRIEIYTNLFELQLIENQPFDPELEQQFIEDFQNKKDIFISYELLKIMQNIFTGEEVNIELWKQKYRQVDLNWDFNILVQWVDGVENKNIKIELIKALKIFKSHNLNT